jgi:short-subunit dehydrogenase
MDTNTMGTIMMDHAVLPAMVARGKGCVVNVVSTGALYTRKSISVYSTSKWAIRGFTGCLEAEYAPQGIRVMGFYPGKIASNMYARAGIDRDLDVAMTPDQAAAMIVTMLDDETMVWSHVSGRSISDYT